MNCSPISFFLSNQRPDTLKGSVGFYILRSLVVVAEQRLNEIVCIPQAYFKKCAFLVGTVGPLAYRLSKESFLARLARISGRLLGVFHGLSVMRILTLLFIGAFATVWIGCDRRSGSQGPQSPQGAQQSAAPGGAVVKFSRVSVHDEQMNNMEAFSVLVPEGWDEEAGVTWDPTLAELAYLQLKVSDPQSGAELQFLPPQKYVYMPNPVMPLQEGANYMGSIVGTPITDLDQYVRTVYASGVLPELQEASIVSRQEVSNIETEL